MCYVLRSPLTSCLIKSTVALTFPRTALHSAKSFGLFVWLFENSLAQISSPNSSSSFPSLYSCPAKLVKMELFEMLEFTVIMGRQQALWPELS